MRVSHQEESTTANNNNNNNTITKIKSIFQSFASHSRPKGYTVEEQEKTSENKRNVNVCMKMVVASKGSGG